MRDVLRARRESFWYRTASSENPQQAWGYVDVHSIAAGEPFRVMLGAGPSTDDRLRGTVEIHRIGWHPEGHRRLVWSGADIDVEPRGLDVTGATVGAHWAPSLEVSDTDDWVSGYYSIDFVGGDGRRDADIAYLVVVDPNHGCDVLVKLATTTYQAYNRWGGHNLYDWETPATMDGDELGRFETDIPSNRGAMVSFDRPTRSEFFEWEYWYIAWLERVAAESGISVAYATNHDLATDPRFTHESPLLIIPGHDEYWSKEEFELAHERIFERGGNTLFLGANLAYWQVRYADVNSLEGRGGRQLVCFKSSDDPIRIRVDDPDAYVTTRFRDGARLPETMLMGVGYQSNLAYRRLKRPELAYRVVNTDLPFCADAGYDVGDEITGVLGHEWDNVDPEARFAPPGEQRVQHAVRLWSPEHSRIAAIPENDLTVVFSGSVEDLEGRSGQANAVYFTTPAGAKVFSSGTLRWNWPLGRPGTQTDDRFDRLNRGLLSHLLP